MLWMVCPPPAPAHCSASPHPTPVFFFSNPEPDIQIPKEESTSPESEIKSGIHILCKCTLLEAGMESGFGIMILERADGVESSCREGCSQTGFAGGELCRQMEKLDLLALALSS